MPDQHHQRVSQNPKQDPSAEEQHPQAPSSETSQGQPDTIDPLLAQLLAGAEEESGDSKEPLYLSASFPHAPLPDSETEKAGEGEDAESKLPIAAQFFLFSEEDMSLHESVERWWQRWRSASPASLPAADEEPTSQWESRPAAERLGVRIRVFADPLPAPTLAMLLAAFIELHTKLDFVQF